MTYRAWEQKPLDRAAVRELTAAIAEQAAAQLEEQTMDEAPWSDEKYKAVLAAQQKENALLAGILAARGITDPAEALTLLAGEEELSDPALLTDMDAACQRIWQAIDNGETIAVFGDYDVDGVTATALLYQHLKGMGATVKCMLPSREGDGYGLSKNAIQSMHNKGCTLIVTVDNGISAVEEADFAASLGMDLIITDHHLPPETLPKAVAVVDPRREDDHSPFKGLCGAGVAFKLCAALDGCPPEELLEQWLAAFTAAVQAGRNPIMEKYARMMESTDPQLYAGFADQLPELSPEFVQLREAVIAIQIPWMEEFTAKYPHLGSRARVIHTAEDSTAQTSYETYLRGELSVYPFEVLYGYGRWVVSLYQAGKNLACMTMAETVRAYGYASLEAAEQACAETPLSGIPLQL